MYMSFPGVFMRAQVNISHAVCLCVIHMSLLYLVQISPFECTSMDRFCLQVGQTAEALNAARAEVAQAEKDAAAVKKRADDLTVAAGKKSAEADEYRDKWEKMKQQVSVAKSAEREHWERAKQVSRLCA